MLTGNAQLGLLLGKLHIQKTGWCSLTTEDNLVVFVVDDEHSMPIPNRISGRRRS